jgi:predicted Zn-dependent protease with MMP-like domain
MKSLPAEYKSRLDNVEITVARQPSRHQRESMRIEGELYGLYEGIPLPRRGSWYGMVAPDMITIFWEPLVRDFPDNGALADQVQRTVYHEIAHHFGISDEELAHSSVE